MKDMKEKNIKEKTQQKKKRRGWNGRQGTV